jgi:hypothetical protein
MVAPAYSNQRSAPANQLGLGMEICRAQRLQYLPVNFHAGSRVVSFKAGGIWRDSGALPDEEAVRQTMGPVFFCDRPGCGRPGKGSSWVTARDDTSSAAETPKGSIRCRTTITLA